MPKKTRKDKVHWLERAFSVRQPWAHLIFHGGKDVENRSQPTRYRGSVAVHVSTTMNKSLVRSKGLDPDELPAGAVVGYVDLIDCVRKSKSKWAERGKWHWILANPRLLKKPIAMNGWLGVFPLKRRIRIGK